MKFLRRIEMLPLVIRFHIWLQQYTTEKTSPRSARSPSSSSASAPHHQNSMYFSILISILPKLPGANIYVFSTIFDLFSTPPAHPSRATCFWTSATAGGAHLPPERRRELQDVRQLSASHAAFAAVTGQGQATIASQVG